MCIYRIEFADGTHEGVKAASVTPGPDWVIFQDGGQHKYTVAVLPANSIKAIYSDD